MNSLANPDNYKLSARQLADVYYKGNGLTNMGALEIQRYVLGQITHF